jgi:hypothetical protein
VHQLMMRPEYDHRSIPTAKEKLAMRFPGAIRRARVLLIAITLGCGGTVMAGSEAHALINASITIGSPVHGADTNFLLLTGTWQCDPSGGNVQIADTADQVLPSPVAGTANDQQINVCDGQVHTWKLAVQGAVGTDWEEGTAVATATLVPTGGGTALATAGPQGVTVQE